MRSNFQQFLIFILNNLNHVCQYMTSQKNHSVLWSKMLDLSSDFSTYLERFDSGNHFIFTLLLYSVIKFDLNAHYMNRETNAIFPVIYKSSTPDYSNSE